MIRFTVKDCRGTNGHGQGRWHSRQVLYRSKLKARRARKLASMHRAINRRAA